MKKENVIYNYKKDWKNIAYLIGSIFLIVMICFGITIYNYNNEIIFLENLADFNADDFCQKQQYNITWSEYEYYPNNYRYDCRSVEDWQEFFKNHDYGSDGSYIIGINFSTNIVFYNATTLATQHYTEYLHSTNMMCGSTESLRVNYTEGEFDSSTMRFKCTDSKSYIPRVGFFDLKEVMV